MIDVIIISGTINKDIKKMTQNAIDSCGVKNIYVIETANKKVNYNIRHHADMLDITFKNTKENVNDYSVKHLKELEKFNEQLSSIV